MNSAAFAGLDLLATAVIVANDEQAVLYMNPAAENLFEASNASAAGLPLAQLFGENPVRRPVVGVDGSRRGRGTYQRARLLRVCRGGKVAGAKLFHTRGTLFLR